MYREILTAGVCFLSTPSASAWRPRADVIPVPTDPGQAWDAAQGWLDRAASLVTSASSDLWATDARIIRLHVAAALSSVSATSLGYRLS